MYFEVLLQWPRPASILTPVQRDPLAIPFAVPNLSYSEVQPPSIFSVHIRFPRERHDVRLAHNAQGSPVHAVFEERLLESLHRNDSVRVGFEVRVWGRVWGTGGSMDGWVRGLVLMVRYLDRLRAGVSFECLPTTAKASGAILYICTTERLPKSRLLWSLVGQQAQTVRQRLVP